jgi:hypothetical protein
MELFERCVTEAEAAKGHITIVERERGKFEQHFGKILHEDDPRGRDEDFYKEFTRKDTGRTVRLKLCMRNKPRRELRLYLSKTAKDGYKISGNRILAVEFINGRAFISSRAVGLRRLGLLYPKKRSAAKLRRPRDEEVKINERIHEDGPPRKLTARQRATWARSAKLARKCLEGAGFHCEAGWTNNPFKSKATGRTYAEVHHLIPLKYQSQFPQKRLDTLLNLCCLSPQAHRAIHYGTDEQVVELLELLLDKRAPLKKKFGISADILSTMYGIE